MTLTGLKITLIGINHAVAQLVETPINEHFTLTEAVEAYDHISDTYSDLLDFACEVQEHHLDRISDTLIEKLSGCIDDVLKAVNSMNLTNEIKSLEQAFGDFIEICSEF